MKNLFLFTSLLLIICTNISFSQDDYIESRLNGNVIDNYIYFQIVDPKGTLEYYLSNKKQTSINSQSFDVNDESFIIDNSKSKITTYIFFYNPLKYQIKSSFTEVDDEVTKVLDDFYKQIPTSLISTILPPATTSGTASTGATAMSTLENTSAANTSVKKFNNSPLLYQWIFEFQKQYPNKIRGAAAAPAGAALPDTNNVSNLNKFIDKINNISKVEFYIYDDGKYLVDAKSDLYTKNTYTDFSGKINSLEATELKIIKASKKDAVEKLQTIIKLLTDDFDKEIAVLFNAGVDTKDFKEYSKATANKLQKETLKDFELQNDRLSSFEKLIDELKKFTNEFDETIKKGGKTFNYKKLEVIKLNTILLKKKSFTYLITQLDKDGATIEKGGSKSECQFIAYQESLPYISISGIFSNVSFPNYFVREVSGQNVVAPDISTSIRLKPAVFLNLIPTKRINSSFLYPFSQIGFSMAGDNFLIPIGLGVSIGKNFSISTGLMNGIGKRLDKLQEGSVVTDQAALKKDLVYDWFPGAYFSINFAPKLGKK